MTYFNAHFCAPPFEEGRERVMGASSPMEATSWAVMIVNVQGMRRLLRSITRADETRAV